MAIGEGKKRSWANGEAVWSDGIFKRNDCGVRALRHFVDADGEDDALEQKVAVVGIADCDLRRASVEGNESSDVAALHRQDGILSAQADVQKAVGLGDEADSLGKDEVVDVFAEGHGAEAELVDAQSASFLFGGANSVDQSRVGFLKK